jgi:hypothetical protein
LSDPLSASLSTSAPSSPAASTVPPTTPAPPRPGETTRRAPRRPRERSPLISAEASPRFSGREIALLVLGSLVLSIITSWPLILHMGSRIDPDLGDPIRTAWQIAVEGHQLLYHPLHLFQTNAFWPYPNSLTFSDSLLGYAPAGLVGSGTTAALVRYNLLFQFAWTLPVIGAYLLGRELGLRPAAAAIAGAAFAYAPFKAAEAGHLHVISSGGIALAFFLLLRGYRRRSWKTVLAGWLVATWQLSLGFTLGLPFAYTLLVVALVAIYAWWRRGAARLPEAVLIASIVGIGLFMAMGVFEARPYLKTANDFKTATRAMKEIKSYSASPKAFLAAAWENRVWGGITKSIRYSLRSRNESVLFPGLITFVLAMAGMGAAVFTRRLRWWLLGGTLVFASLALGLDFLPGGYPYRLVHDVVPGWKGVRVPGRIYTMTALGLALLAGAGMHRLLAAASRRSASASPRLRAAVVPVITVLLFSGIVFEGAGREPHPVVPKTPPSTAALPQPQLYLPSITSSDRLFQFWSVNGYPKIVNGVSTFDIHSIDDLRGGMQNFPDVPGVRKLQRLGIRTVVLDPQVLHFGLPPDKGAIYEPPNPSAAAVKSIRGLPVKRFQLGPLTIFEIEPSHQ